MWVRTATATTKSCATKFAAPISPEGSNSECARRQGQRWLGRSQPSPPIDGLRHHSSSGERTTSVRRRSACRGALLDSQHAEVARPLARCRHADPKGGCRVGVQMGCARSVGGPEEVFRFTGSGVSAATRVAIQKLEEDRLWPGAVPAALAECRSYLSQPGRVLPDPVMGCECCDPLVARDRLEDMLLWLPRGARADLDRLVFRLNIEFDRRAVPLSPHLLLAASWGECGSWRRRLLEN